MSRAKQVAFLAVLVVTVLVCWAYVRQTRLFHGSKQVAGFWLSQKDLQWQARAKATADDPKLARRVILDGIYEDEALAVALGYQEAMNEDSTSQARIANFAHAVVIANQFYDTYKHHQNLKAFIDLIDQGRTALQPLIERRQYVRSEEEQKEYKNFKPTKIADAWLAWANYCDNKQAEAAYHHALQLDPTLGEAYYQEAHRATAPFGQAYFNAHYARALQQLDKAEQVEPRLRRLVVLDRGAIASILGDRRLAIASYQEFLRLWPDAPQSAVIRQDIAGMEASEKKPDAT